MLLGIMEAVVPKVFAGDVLLMVTDACILAVVGVDTAI